MAFKLSASGCIDNGADDGNLDADQGERGYNSVSGCCGCLRRPVVGSFLLSPFAKSARWRGEEGLRVRVRA